MILSFTGFMGENIFGGGFRLLVGNENVRNLLSEVPNFSTNMRLSISSSNIDPNLKKEFIASSLKLDGVINESTNTITNCVEIIHEESAKMEQALGEVLTLLDKGTDLHNELNKHQLLDKTLKNILVLHDILEKIKRV